MNAALGVSLVALLFSSVPVAVAIGVASIIGILVYGNLPLLIVPQRMFAGLDSFPLMAVPLFILAGNLMSRGAYRCGWSTWQNHWLAACGAVWALPVSSPA